MNARSVPEPAPVGSGEFEVLARRCGLDARSAAPLAVAVSGGADSLALLHLTKDWSQACGRPLTALTVDHGLRSESGREADILSRTLEERGIRHRILRWHHPPLEQGVQAAARKARYRLLRTWCQANGVSELLLGHHLDDQAETFLLRTGAKSGLRGLGCMRARHSLEGVTLLRPLLDLPRSRLRATVRHLALAWLDDPSNRDCRHTRVRIRNLLSSPEVELPAGAELARAARMFARLGDALVQRTFEYLSPVATPLGTFSLSRARLADLPGSLAVLVLASLMQAVSGNPYPPRSRSLESLRRSIVCPSRREARTLGGVAVHMSPESAILFRERAAVAGPRILLPGMFRWWDGRYRVEHRGSRLPVTVGALGPDLRSLPPSVKTRFPGVPGKALETLPAFRRLDEVIAVPHLNCWGKAWHCASLRATFEPVDAHAFARHVPGSAQ